MGDATAVRAPGGRAPEGSSPTAATAGDRLHHLDSLRGLAALSVVWSHFASAYGLPLRGAVLVQNTPLHLLWDGYAAVSFFFVLSGLVLTKRYFENPRALAHPSFHLAGFYARRVCRIWLPFVAVLALTWVASELASPPDPTTFPRPGPWLLGLWSAPPDLARLLQEALIVLPRPAQRLIPQDWTLTVELNVSFIVPMLAWIALRGSAWLVALATAGVAFLGLPVFVVHFAVGMLLARHYRELSRRIEGWGRAAHVALGTAAVLLYTFRFTLPALLPGVFSDDVIWIVTGLGGAGFILLASGSTGFRSTLLWRPLRFLGRISYSLYLSHLTVLVLVTPPLLAALNGVGVDGPWSARLCALAGLTIATVLVAWPLQVFVEEPSMRLGRTLDRRLRAAG